PPECQASPGGRLHPGEIVLRPGPADQLHVDIVQFPRLLIGRNLALNRQQPSQDRFVWLSQGRLNEKRQGCWPDRFFPAICEPIRSIRRQTAREELLPQIDLAFVLVGFQGKSQKSQASRLQLGRLPWVVPPSTIRMSLAGKELQRSGI